jgi:putative DNA primase/helicase
MPPPSSSWQVSAGRIMNRDGPFRARAPLTAIEAAQRAAALKANHAQNQRSAPAVSPGMMDEDAAIADAAGPERNDAFPYGKHAAKILSDGRRDVALASADEKRTVFREVAKTFGQAVADQWIPKSAMMDRLVDIAETHGCFGLNAEQLQQLIAESAPTIRVAQSAPVSTAPKRRLITHRASDLQPEKLTWVWQGRIAAGKLVLLGGPPGLGKSQLTAFVTATISNGGDWPCNEGSTAVGSVIFMSAEDGIEDTIVPRLMAAGANLDRVHIVASATKPDGTGRKTFSLKTDVDLLEAKAKEIGDVRLIVVDPISAYMGGSDGNGNVETREVLEPLAEMANRLHIAVLAVTHLNKGGGGGNQTAMSRFCGSIAFIAAARSAFAVLPDPENEERRFLLQAKNNLAKNCNGLVFRMEQRLVSEGIVSSNVIFFENEQVSQSIDDALTASEARGRSGGSQSGSKPEIVEFLNEVLANGPVDVLEVERLARLAALLGDTKGIRDSKPFRAARVELSVLSTREGFGPGSRYLLSLPGIPCAPKNTMGAHSQDRAHMEDKGAHDAVDVLALGSSEAGRLQ